MYKYLIPNNFIFTFLHETGWDWQSSHFPLQRNLQIIRFVLAHWFHIEDRFKRVFVEIILICIFWKKLSFQGETDINVVDVSVYHVPTVLISFLKRANFFLGTLAILDRGVQFRNGNIKGPYGLVIYFGTLVKVFKWHLFLRNMLENFKNIDFCQN